MKSNRRWNRLSGSTQNRVVKLIERGWKPTRRAENKERFKRAMSIVMDCAQWNRRAD